MNSERDYELMTKARILALAQTELSILRRLPHLQGQELREAAEQLDIGRYEQLHLNKMLQEAPEMSKWAYEPKDQTEREHAQGIEACNQEALATARDQWSPETARGLVAGDLAALGAITSEAVRFAAMATMGSTAEEQRAYHEALDAAAPDIARDVALAHAAVTRVWEVMQAERATAIQTAEYAIIDYIGANQAIEYAYIDTFNPQGLPDSHFHEQARLARVDMMKALAALPDEIAEAVLHRKQAVDHDRSTYSVAQIGEVRAYRTVLAGRADPAVSAVERQRANEELRYQIVSTAASDLRNAIQWGDEQAFHDAFEAIQNNPALDAAATVEIAKIVTDWADVPPTQTAALGAIEQHFYSTSRSQEQTHAQGMGR